MSYVKLNTMFWNRVVKPIQKASSYYYNPTLNVSLPNPTDKTGKWIGWPDKKVEEFLRALSKHQANPPNKKY